MRGANADLIVKKCTTTDIRSEARLFKGGSEKTFEGDR